MRDCESQGGMEARVIPAFYCCYLLRSTQSHSSLYVGSTPNLSRRLAQHNGHAKGGAVRTSKKGLQPWETTVIVEGFPSNIAALQFEWAWHNTHLTKKISDDQRITPREAKSRSSKARRAPRRPARPRASLIDKISNLHLLLRVPSFARWPLQVRFFCEDVFNTWRIWCDRTDGEIRSDLDILLDTQRSASPPAVAGAVNGSQGKELLECQAQISGGVPALDVGYVKLKRHVEKSLLLTTGANRPCAVCSNEVVGSASTALICPQTKCEAISHLVCLAELFRIGTEANSVLPRSGNCPSCQEKIRWIDLVKNLSLRMRGAKELDKLFKKPRATKGKIAQSKVSHPESSYPRGRNDGPITQGEEGIISLADTDDELPEDWLEQCEDDSVSVSSTESGMSSSETLRPTRAGTSAAYLGTVVEDSDWDHAEILD